MVHGTHLTWVPVDLNWILGIRIGKIMEPVRNGGNGMESGSPIAILMADISRLDRKLDDRLGKVDDRIGKLDDRVAALGERVAKVETGIDFLRSDIKNLSEGLLAVRTTDFRLMFSALIAVALALSAMMAKGFGWL